MSAPVTFRFPECFDDGQFDAHRAGQLALSVSGRQRLPQGCARLWAEVLAPAGLVDHASILGEAHVARAKRLFERDRAAGDAMASNVGGCRVFTHAWSDEAFSFRYFWIELPADRWLQVLCVLDPAFAAFFKWQLMMSFFHTSLDAGALVAAAQAGASATAMFAVEPAPMDGDLIDEALRRAEELRAEQSAPRSLNVADENFAERAAKALNARGEVLVDGLFCQDWATHYTYGAHNFSDPDSDVEWQDNDGLLHVHEPPWSTSEVVEVTAEDGDAEAVDVSWLPHMAAHADAIERSLLKVLEQFVFDEGAGYADATCFEWVKVEAERMLGEPMTRSAFFKRNVAVGDIQLLPGAPAGDASIRVWLRCSWDEEHGMAVRVDALGHCWRDDDV